MPIRLGPFSLVRTLGEGGMGVVWHAHHERDGAAVAVKVMTEQSMRAERCVAAFRNEVRAMAGMDHPGIVEVLENGVVRASDALASGGALPDGAPFLVMALAAGGTVALHPPRSWPRLRALLHDVLGALAHAHARGVVHLDLKPANVLIDGDGRYLLTDFGIAHAIGEGERNLNAGTAQYMAPEQFIGNARDLGPWTDLYSLGCMAWRLAARRRLWDGIAADLVPRAHRERALPAFTPAYPVPIGFETWLRRLLVKQRAGRWAFAADAASSLAQLEEPARHPKERDARVAPRTIAPMPSTWERSPPVPLAAPERAPLESREGLVGAGLSLVGVRRLPFVGRRAVRDEMWRALLDVSHTRQSRALVCRGATGSGTSRLAQWLCERAHEVGAATTAVARHEAHLGGWEGLGRLVSHLARAHGLDRTGTRLRLAGLLGEGASFEQERLHALTECVHVADDDSGAHVLPIERRSAVRWLLARVAQERPVVVWLDDVHWSPESLSLVREALDDEAFAGVLFVCTVVDDALGAVAESAASLGHLEEHPRCETHEIGPLPPGEHAELVRELLGFEGVLERRVRDRTQGSPLFAVQLVGDLVQRGLLIPGRDGFQLAPNTTITPPADLSAVWEDRVERVVEGLPDDAPLALAIAASLGAHFALDEWHEACRFAALGLPWLLEEALVAQRLLALESAPEAGRRFAHPMVHEAIVRWARRRGLHESAGAACAAMLELRPGAGARERRARHLAASGDHGRAGPLLLRAAVLRHARGDLDAVHELVRLREVSLTAHGISPEDPAWGEGWMLRARAATIVGRVEDAEAMLQRVDDRSHRPGWEWLSARVVVTRAYLAQRSDSRRAHTLYGAGLQRCHEVGDEVGVSRAHHGLAFTHRVAGRFEESRRHALQCLELNRRLDRAAGAADALRALGDIARSTSDLEDAARRYHQSLGVPGLEGNVAGRAECLIGLGEICRLSGDLDGAEDWYAQAARLQQMVDADPTTVQVNRAIIRLCQGRYDEARPVLEKVLTRWERHPNSVVTVCVLLALLPCHAVREDWQAWDADLARVRASLSVLSLFDPDLVILADIAAALASRLEQPDRAATVRELADRQRQGLGAAPA